MAKRKTTKKKSYVKVHTSNTAAQRHIKRIRKRGGNVTTSKNRGKTTVKSFY